VRPLLRIVAARPPAERIAQTEIESPMQRGKRQISLLKPTDREGAARTEISFNCVAYHQPRGILRRRFSQNIQAVLEDIVGFGDTIFDELVEALELVVG